MVTPVVWNDELQRPVQAYVHRVQAQAQAQAQLAGGSLPQAPAAVDRSAIPAPADAARQPALKSSDRASLATHLPPANEDPPEPAAPPERVAEAPVHAPRCQDPLETAASSEGDVEACSPDSDLSTTWGQISPGATVSRLVSASPTVSVSVSRHRISLGKALPPVSPTRHQAKRPVRRGRSCGAADVGRRSDGAISSSTAVPLGTRWRQRSGDRQRKAGDSGPRLEETLRVCRRKLERTELEVSSTGRRRVSQQEAVLELVQQLEGLAIESFQCSCARNVPGAMDVFEDTQDLLSRAGDLLSADAAVLGAQGGLPGRLRSPSPLAPIAPAAPFATAGQAGPALEGPGGASSLGKAAAATRAMKPRPHVGSISCFGGLMQMFSSLAKSAAVDPSTVKHWTA